VNQSIKAALIIATALIIGAIALLGLGNALSPLLIAFALAYLSFPLIRRLERHGIPRAYAVAGVLAVGAAVLVLVAVLVIPSLFREMKEFVQELPETSAVAVEKLENLASSFGYTLDISRQGLKDFIAENASGVSGEFLKSSSNFLKRIFSNFLGGILFILNLILIPIFFFHLVNRYEDISREAKDLLPLPLRPKAKEYAQYANKVLSGYIRGQMLVALILAALYGIGFSIIRLKFGLLIGVCTGLLSIIPFVGSILGFIAAMAVALANFTGFGTIGAVVLVFAIVQALEGFVITPRLVGNKVGLSILSTMLALIIGGNLFGFVGMIVAIPLAAIMKSILRDLKAEYQALNLYRG
jgi:predicted PurR-regulated permease PerM